MNYNIKRCKIVLVFSGMKVKLRYCIYATHVSHVLYFFRDKDGANDSQDQAFSTGGHDGMGMSIYLIA